MVLASSGQNFLRSSPLYTNRTDPTLVKEMYDMGIVTDRCAQTCLERVQGIRQRVSFGIPLTTGRAITIRHPLGKWRTKREAFALAHEENQKSVGEVITDTDKEFEDEITTCRTTLSSIPLVAYLTGNFDALNHKARLEKSRDGLTAYIDRKKAEKDTFARMAKSLGQKPKKIHIAGLSQAEDLKKQLEESIKAVHRKITKKKLNKKKESVE